MSRDPFPPEFFRRMDELPDAELYREPRFVTHIDDATIGALTQVYRELIPSGSHVLDLMSSWVSHLPPDVHRPPQSGHRRIPDCGLQIAESPDRLRGPARCHTGGLD
jgi:hypothetical protein